MGFNLSSFAGGFAEAFTEDIEKEEKLAELRGMNGVKSMKENYDARMEENSKLKNQVLQNIETLRVYDPTATQEELFEIAKSKPLMELIAAKVKSGDYDADTMKLSTFAKVQSTNTPKTAIELTNDLFKIPTIVKKADEEQAAKKSSGNFFKDIVAGAGSKTTERAARQTAEAMGVSLEELQAAKEYKTPVLTSRAMANMAAFKKEETFDQVVSKAKVRMAIAAKTGDKEAFGLAQADLAIYSKVQSEMSDPQKEFANKIADVKNRYMFGTPEERAAAKPEYDKLMSDIRNEAAAKKAGEGGKDDKIPAMGTLNTFVSGAVARRVAEAHGDLVKSKQLAIIDRPDGSASVEYIGDDPVLRNKVNQTAYKAAQSALSLYTDANGQPLTRDVASIINSYKPEYSNGVNVEEPAPTGNNVANLRKEAQAAIAKGADRTAVAKRFKDQTGQEF
jgi:hypothetical protein